MTEEAWFASRDVFPMLASLGERPGARKLRLFGCACLRLLGDVLPWEAQECLKYVEKAVDGLLKWHEAVLRVTSRTSSPDLPIRTWLPACLLASSAAAAASDGAYLAGAVLANGVSALEEWVGPYGTWDYRPRPWLLEFRDFRAETARLVPLLHEIVGNPFRPVTFSPTWRTTTAVQLARQMYEGREFSAMPILADALQDAGCESEDVLTHCRDPQAAHVRGCWVVDLVLGKS
jgi:hypothetical protein